MPARIFWWQRSPSAMVSSLELYVTSRRQFRVESFEADGAPSLASAAVARIERAFLDGQGAGLLHLATQELKSSLPPGLAFARGFAQRYVTQLCHVGDLEALPADEALIAPPADEELGVLVLDAPPLRGLEYLDTEALRAAWHGKTSTPVSARKSRDRAGRSTACPVTSGQTACQARSQAPRAEDEGAWTQRRSRQILTPLRIPPIALS